MANKSTSDSKHPVSTPVKKEEKQVWTIQVYSEYEKTHIPMTLEKSVRDVIKNWNACDYAIGKEQFDVSTKQECDIMVSTMKRCGYVPVLNSKGEMKPSQGMYRFTHVPS